MEGCQSVLRLRRGVLLVGALPPPVGGVTAHIKRFVDYAASIGLTIPVLDLKKRCMSKNGKTLRFWEALCVIYKAEIVHIHVSNDAKVLIAFFFWVFGKKVVYTHHNSIINHIFVFKVLSFFCHSIIFVNSLCIPSYLKNDPRKSIVLPAFIPPPAVDAPLPSWLQQELCKYDKILVTNCYKRNYINAEEVYGFDLLIAAFAQMDSERKIANSLLVLLDPSGTYQDAYQYQDLVSRVNGNAILYVGEAGISYVSLLRKATISIRATRTDGDSLSVREALYLGIPVIASDIVERPVGTVLFKSGSSFDLANRISAVLSGQVFGAHQSFNCADEIFKIYSEING